jgi:hypothetical protein
MSVVDTKTVIQFHINSLVEQATEAGHMDAKFEGRCDVNGDVKVYTLTGRLDGYDLVVTTVFIVGGGGKEFEYSTTLKASVPDASVDKPGWFGNPKWQTADEGFGRKLKTLDLAGWLLVQNRVRTGPRTEIVYQTRLAIAANRLTFTGPPGRLQKFLDLAQAIDAFG